MSATEAWHFTFIIPVKELNDYIDETVDHLLHLPESNWDALIVTNDPQESKWTDSRIKVISSGRVGPGEKRDLAAEVAQGNILVFLDDDSYPRSNFLNVLTQTLSAGHVAIGGPSITPTDNSFWQQVSGAVFLSRLTGGVPERYIPSGSPREVRDWPSVNLSMKQEVFAAAGGFGCHFWPGEDTYLCEKLSAIGHKVHYQPSLMVWHHRRPTVRGHLKQVGGYGLHRGYFAMRGVANSRRLVYFAPSALLITLAFSLVAALTLTPLPLLGALSLYGAIVLLGAVQASTRSRWRLLPGIVLYVPLTHIVYGWQFVRGALHRGPLVSKLR